MILYVGDKNKYIPKGAVGEVVSNGYKNRDHFTAKFVLSNRILDWCDPDDFGNRVEVTTLVKKKDCVKILADPIEQNKALQIDDRVIISWTRDIKKGTYDFVKDQVGIIRSIEDNLAYIYWDRVGVIPVPTSMVLFDDAH